MSETDARLDVEPHSTPNGVHTEMLHFGERLHVGLSRYALSDALHGDELGDDWLKFHFQLRGAAAYSVPGESRLLVDDLTAALVFHGRGIVKSSSIDAQPGFAVTILCKPDVLTERFGIDLAEVPAPISRYFTGGDLSWFCEAGKMTPGMAMSVHALESMQFQGAMRSAYVEARSVELLCDLWANIAGHAARPNQHLDDRTLSKVEQTRDYIDAHFAAPLAMQNLARNVGTNETKLAQTFRTVYGMTVFEYVRSCRMEEARRLLRTGNLSVTEIAFEVGYEYSCNFSVAYKRHFGVTPKQERASAHA